MSESFIMCCGLLDRMRFQTFKDRGFDSKILTILTTHMKFEGKNKKIGQSTHVFRKSFQKMLNFSEKRLPNYIMRPGRHSKLQNTHVRSIFFLEILEKIIGKSMKE